MSSSKNRREQMRAAKERRQKQLVIGGAVLLAIVLAIQAPRMLHRGGSSASATATTTTETTAGTATTPTSGTTAPAPVTPAVPGAVTAEPTTSSKLPDSDLVPLRNRAQLASFELFDSKDPFVQQVSDVAPTTPATTAAGTAAAPPATATPAPAASAAPAAPTSPATPPAAPATVAATQPPVTLRTLAHTGGAVITVNGKSEHVGVGETFPSSSPTFKLVSLGSGTAMIGIASGGYASGAQTVALRIGRTLTLVDTTNGVRYELGLVSSS
jgi:hypothetical protein